MPHQTAGVGRIRRDGRVACGREARGAVSKGFTDGLAAQPVALVVSVAVHESDVGALGEQRAQGREPVAADKVARHEEALGDGHRVSSEVERDAERGLHLGAVEVPGGLLRGERDGVLWRGDVEVVDACVEAVVQGGKAVAVRCEAGFIHLWHVAVTQRVVLVSERDATRAEVAAGRDGFDGGLVVRFVDGLDPVGVVHGKLGVKGGLDDVVDAGVDEADGVDGDLDFGFGGAVLCSEALVLLHEVVCVGGDVVAAVRLAPEADAVVG